MEQLNVKVVKTEIQVIKSKEQMSNESRSVRGGSEKSAPRLVGSPIKISEAHPEMEKALTQIKHFGLEQTAIQKQNEISIEKNNLAIADLRHDVDEHLKKMEFFDQVIRNMKGRVGDLQKREQDNSARISLASLGANSQDPEEE